MSVSPGIVRVGNYRLSQEKDMRLRKRTRKRLRTIGGWVLFGIVVIFLAEWVARGMQDKLMDPAENPHLTFDPALSFTYKPYHTKDLQNPSGERIVIDISSLGLRDREITAKGTGETRIAGIGDSFTAATQVSQSSTYLRQIDRLAAESGGNIRTINAATDGYDLQQSSDLLMKLGEQLDPDVVLLGLYVGDDIRDYDKKEGLSLPAKSFFKRNSYLYHLLRRGYHRIKDGKEAVVPDDAGHLATWREKLAPYGEPPDDETILRLVRSARHEVSIFREGGIDPAAQSSTENILRRIRDCARTHDAEFLIALIPTKLQVVPMELVKATALLDLETGSFDLAQPQKIVTGIADRLQIPTLDLLPVFRSHPAPDSLYFGGYRYWNEAGHELAAETIYQFLSEGGFLGSGRTGDVDR